MLEHLGESGKAAKAKLEKGWEFVTEVPGDIKDRFTKFREKIREKAAALPEAKRGSLWERAKILASSFATEILGIGREKAKAGQEADSALAKNTNKAVEDVKKTVGVQPVMEATQKQDMDFVFASITVGLDNADGSQQENYSSGLNKMKDGEQLTLDELRAVSGVTMLSLYSLKKQFGVAELTKVFEAFHKSTNNKFGGEALAKAFSVREEDHEKILDIFGVSPDWKDAAAKLAGVGEGGAAMKFGDALKSLSKPGADLEGTAKILHTNGFLNHNALPVVKAINKVATNFSARNLAELVHTIDDRDFVNLSAKLLGKKPGSIKIAGPAVAKAPEVEVAKKAA